MNALLMTCDLLLATKETLSFLRAAPLRLGLVA
jgi:hypothetical protein